MVLSMTDTRCRNAKRYTSTTDAYSLDLNELPTAKDHLKLEKTPTVLVFKNGKELERVDEMNPQAMKGIEEILTA